jgi:DNA polymerase III subunit epsilon
VARLDSIAARRYRDAPLPGDSTSWREVTYSVVDLELTGLDPRRDEIISFAAVTVAGGKVLLRDARYGLVRPGRMPTADTIRIHGLREVDLEEAPPLSEVLDQLLEALTGRALVAHVAAIETGFLAAALESHGLALRNPVVDTAALAVELTRLRRESRPPDSGEAADPVPISSPGLGDLAGWLGLPIHRPHHADGDALTTAQAFVALATHLEAFEQPLTLRALRRITEQQRRNRPGSTIRRLIGRLRPGAGNRPRT